MAALRSTTISRSVSSAVNSQHPATNRRSKLSLLVVTASLLLVACQGQYKVAESRALPNIGTRIVLNSTLPIAPESARVIVQNGEVKSKPNLYVPWCTFFVHRPRSEMSQASEIQADEFLVDKTYRRYDYSASIGTEPKQVAAIILDVDDGSQNSNITQSVYFEVSSESQPQVRRIVCSIFADPTLFAYPSMAEIKVALDGIATFVEQ